MQPFLDIVSKIIIVVEALMSEMLFHLWEYMDIQKFI